MDDPVCTWAILSLLLLHNCTVSVWWVVYFFAFFLSFLLYYIAVSLYYVYGARITSRMGDRFLHANCGHRPLDNGFNSFLKYGVMVF